MLARQVIAQVHRPTGQLMTNLGSFREETWQLSPLIDFGRVSQRLAPGLPLEPCLEWLSIAGLEIPFTLHEASP
jgi:hypothetical protein